MNENYDAKLCEEKNKRVDERLDTHDTRLNSHSQRLDKLEQNDIENRTEIKNLCEQIKSLVSTMKWFMGIIITAFIGFFFYAIQTHLFK